MHTLTKTILVAIGIVACALVPRISAYVMAGMPKVGSVIDADTGQGMPNMAVLFGAHFDSSPLVHGGANEWLYHSITYTDADGNFRIPGSWAYAKVGIPGTYSGTTWMVTAFKPGYAVAGDEKAWSFDQRGEANFRPRSVEFSPPATWLLFYARLDPLRMVRHDFALKEAAVYYRKVAVLGLTTLSSQDPREVAIRRLGFNALIPRVCALPPDDLLDRTTTEALRFFAIDHATSERQLKELEPYNYQHGSAYPVSYRAGSICHTLRTGDIL